MNNIDVASLGNVLPEAMLPISHGVPIDINIWEDLSILKPLFAENTEITTQVATSLIGLFSLLALLKNSWWYYILFYEVYHKGGEKSCENMVCEVLVCYFGDVVHKGWYRL